MTRPDRSRRPPAARDRGRLIGWLVGGLVAVGGFVTAARLISGAGAGASNSFEPSGRGKPTVPASQQARRAGHETEEMSGGLMGRLVLGLGTAAIAVMLGMAGLNTWLRHYNQATYAPVTALQTAPVTPPLPHLQANPVGELAQLRQAEDTLLSGYAYLDPARTRARIPIGQAMALTVGRSLDSPP